jgi:hypothetical protein
LIRNVLPLAAALAFTFTATVAVAQQDVPPTALQKQLDRIDFAVTGIGMFNKTVSGPILPTGAANFGQSIVDSPSNTLGALVTLRYISKPYVGFEGNYGYARYTENYSNIGGVQTQATEYTLGYLVTPNFKILDFQPFASVGAGSIGFKPTPRGGQGLNVQARAVYYYNVGIQKEFLSEHFGLRGGFRELFFLAPDYGQNYLTIKQRSTTYEPFAGFYLKF